MRWPPLRLLRGANPAVLAVLESPAHRLLSGRLVALTYRGSRSDREFRIPLRFAESAAGSIVGIAVQPEGKLWWRSFSPPRSAVLTLRGRRTAVRGALAEGAERESALASYVARFPNSERLARVAAIVVFTPTTR